MPSNTSDNTPAGTNFRAEFLQIHVSKTTKVAALETFLLDKFTDASLGVHIFFQKLSFEIRPRGNGVLSRALYNMLPGENSALTAKLSQQARRVVRERQHVFLADGARQGNNPSIPLEYHLCIQRYSCYTLTRCRPYVPSLRCILLLCGRPMH